MEQELKRGQNNGLSCDLILSHKLVSGSCGTGLKKVKNALFPVQRELLAESLLLHKYR